MNLIEKIYDLNKKEFHKRNLGKELHHIFRRRKNCIERACYRCFYALPAFHENDYKRVNMIREARQEEFLKIKDNYVKDMGCREYLFYDCNICYMPKGVLNGK